MSTTDTTDQTGSVRDVDVRLALRAPESLRAFNEAGYVRAADVHVATRLGELAGEADPRVLLAVALAVRAVRDGSTALALQTAHDVAPEILDEEEALDASGAPVMARDGAAVSWPEPQAWLEAVAASPLVAAGVLRIEHDLLYLARYAAEERSVCADLLARRAAPSPVIDEGTLAGALDRVFVGESWAQNRSAVDALVRARTGVLTGGPGSGKTTTVAGLLVALADQSEQPLRIALAAPTGKAAARLQEQVHVAASAFPAADRERLAGVEASTLHRLLGWRPGSRTRFAHDRNATLPHDVVIIDESSMLSLTLTARLLEALRPTTRLVLVGDADQLASVDAGAVLGDLVRGLGGEAAGVGGDLGTTTATDAAALDTDPPVSRSAAVAPDAGRRDADKAVPVARVVRLAGSKRFGGAVGALASAVRDGDADRVIEVLRGGEGVELVEEDAQGALKTRLVDHAQAVRDAALAGDGTKALEVLGEHRLLCAHRAGPFGVRTWNRRVESWLAEATGASLFDMYVGRPLIVTANDYGLGLYNGDTGVVVASGDPGAPPVAVLAGSAGEVRLAATRLGDVDTMHAMTIHKSQGSEAKAVTVLMPPIDSPLATRELFYTAVTRAKESVTVVGSEEAIRAALARRARRASGLAARLRDP
ncbi:MAG: exodeoxyribonuclease V subunit alpha [Mobilicoccus sp.]|nr:exodeoxyribonuclease V subunit alpha [Mobilicoccus sp.]